MTARLIVPTLTCARPLRQYGLQKQYLPTYYVGAVSMIAWRRR